MLRGEGELAGEREREEGRQRERKGDKRYSLSMSSRRGMRCARGDLGVLVEMDLF